MDSAGQHLNYDGMKPGAQFMITMQQFGEPNRNLMLSMCFRTSATCMPYIAGQTDQLPLQSNVAQTSEAEAAETAPP